MQSTVSRQDAERLLAESQRLKAEAAAMRPRTRWLTRHLEQIIEDNHLSQRIREALEP